MTSEDVTQKRQVKTFTAGHALLCEEKMDIDEWGNGIRNTINPSQGKRKNLPKQDNDVFNHLGHQIKVLKECHDGLKCH
jgi:hypothetical protein